jgi:SanA protein
VRLLLVVLLVLAASVAGTNGYVLARGTGATDDVSSVRPAQVAIVLGALVQPDGRMSGMLQDRVDRALQLWRAKKVSRILVSGDHLRWGYDEPTTMRRALQAAGVPADAIFTDHAGVDTRATMVRARRVFRVRDAIVVTQGFHMGRALYLARAAGLRAQGVTSDLHPYGAQQRRSDLREILARTKSVASQITGAAVLLGPPHPITGDGRGSWGPPAPPAATAPPSAASASASAASASAAAAAASASSSASSASASAASASATSSDRTADASVGTTGRRVALPR